MMSRALKPLCLAAALFVIGLSAVAGSIGQAPSVPAASTGTLYLKDIFARPDIEVIVPPLPERLDGPTVARHLTERYADTRQDCGADDRPAFLCSGVLFRATVPGPYHTWNPNPASSKGTVSFSWLRQDAKFRTIYTPRYSNGFIFFPSADGERYGYHAMEVVCVYPLDATSDARTDLGCGPMPSHYPAYTRPCAEQGIATGEAWVALYRSGGFICSFDVRIGVPHSATSFRQMGVAMAQLPERFQTTNPGYSYTDELLVRTWPQDIHTTIPIEAFFYQAGTANGPGYAKVDQRDFYQVAGRWVPIVRMTMPATEAEDARFDYLPEDQALPLPAVTARIRWVGAQSSYETPAQPLVTDGPTTLQVPRGNVLATLGQPVDVSFVVIDETLPPGDYTSPVLPLNVEAAAGSLPPPELAADRSYARIGYPGMLSTDQIWVSYEGNGTHDTPFPKKTAAFNAGIPPSWLGAPNRIYYWVKRSERILVSPVVHADGAP
ncbi:hypothetical protein [Luteibacter sp. Lutesp34]|uniref:hypothetical protein n=1 Tax=Luteibacter sp. Lutesp34 TaxID=3243030 RepID=UPI0039B49235